MSSSRLITSEKFCLRCSDFVNLGVEKISWMLLMHAWMNSSRLISSEKFCLRCSDFVNLGVEKISWMLLMHAWMNTSRLMPCDIGESKCSKILVLEQHQQEMSKPSNPHYNEEDLKSCDFCGKEFETLGGLRNHIRSLHRDMLPC